MKARVAMMGAIPVEPGSLAHGDALTQGYPGKTMRLVVPFAPGGAPISWAGRLRKKPAEGLKQPAIVDFRYSKVHAVIRLSMSIACGVNIRNNLP
jgi:tripartite-type tricarboxylate transporter receptor subunit TctC